MIETSSAQLTEVVVPAVSYRMGVSRRWDVKKEEITGTKKEKQKQGNIFQGPRYGIWRCLPIQGWDCDLCQPLVAKEVMNLFQMVSKSYYMHWIRFSVLRLYLLSAVIFSSVFIFRRLTEVRI